MARSAAHALDQRSKVSPFGGDDMALLHEGLRLGSHETAEAMSPALLTRWRDMLGPDPLARRLTWNTTAQSAARGPTPGWARLLTAALARPRCEEEAPPGPTPLPFDAALAPFVAAARQALARAAGPAIGYVSPAALTTLEQDLRTLLCHVALPVLSSEFSLRRALAGRLSWLERPGADDDYRAFITELAAGGLQTLLRDYPGLARLLATLAQNWARAHGAMMRRLVRDWPDLRSTLGVVGQTPRIETIETPGSDPHDGGQRVAILRLANGQALVYKPRPVDMEAGLAELLAWANQAGFAWPFRTVAVLARPTYGWMEYVAPAACQDAAAVHRFHARSGGLFCLWWLLQGTDLHHENLIASGEQPVIVDAETLLHPRPYDHVARDLGPGARHGQSWTGDFARALRESGFLPSGQAVDLSAWGTAGQVVTPFGVPACQAVNSNLMSVGQTRFVVAPRPNRAVLDERPTSAADHAGAIVEGFCALHALARRDRAGLLARLDGFTRRQGRFIARATNVYGLLINASLQPEWQRERFARGVCHERLRQAAVQAPRRPDCWPLLDAELAALEQLDVPRFPHRCDRANACWPAPLDAARARVAALSQAALPFQVLALRRALADLAETTAQTQGAST